MAALERTRGISLAMRLALVLLGLAGFALGVNAQGKSSPPPTPVTSTVYDYTDATLSQQLLLRSDDYNAGLQATYSTSDFNVTSQLYDPNGWRLDLTNQTLRKVYLTLSSWVSGAPAPIGDGYYNARVISVCYDANNNVGGF